MPTRARAPQVEMTQEQGALYNMNDGRKTLQNVFALDLFDNVQVGVGVEGGEGELGGQGEA